MIRMVFNIDILPFGNHVPKGYGWTGIDLRTHNYPNIKRKCGVVSVAKHIKWDNAIHAV